MIKINKTQPAPSHLIKRGDLKGQDKCHIETQTACAYFESDSYDPSKKCEYEFKNNVYGNSDWKSQLLIDQHHKCCFCESKFAHVAHGDVEHFRPKGGYVQSSEDPLQKPGYYWLAYEWDNLLVSCSICNQLGKKNFFPLLNPEDRAKKPSDDIGAEEPVLINPWKENPEDFIEFNLEVPRGIDSASRGKKTIELLNLDNNHLSGRREDRLYVISTIIEKIENIDGNTPNPKDLKYIIKSLDDSSEYSGMIRSNFKDKIKELQQKHQS